MYKIDNILIQNYALQPARAPGSNIALEGFLDFPKRGGKTYHDWSEEDGVQPYVAATDRFVYEFANINLYGHIRQANRAAVVKRVEDLYASIGSWEVPKVLSTPYGDYTVFVQDAIEVDYIAEGTAAIRIPFRPVDIVLGNLPAYTPKETGLHHVDNIPFVDFGAFVERVTDNFDRPDTKEQFFTDGDFNTGYQITRPGYKEFTLQMVFYANDYTAFKNNINGFYKQLLEPGTRIMNVDGLERSCFLIEGTQLRNVQVLEDRVIGRMTLTMALAFDGVPVEGLYLLEDDDTPISSNTGKLIKYSSPNILNLVSNSGQEIRNNDFEPITL